MGSQSNCSIASSFETYLVDYAAVLLGVNSQTDGCCVRFTSLDGVHSTFAGWLNLPVGLAFLLSPSFYAFDFSNKFIYLIRVEKCTWLIMESLEIP